MHSSHTGLEKIESLKKWKMNDFELVLQCK